MVVLAFAGGRFFGGRVPQAPPAANATVAAVALLASPVRSPIAPVPAVAATPAPRPPAAAAVPRPVVCLDPGHGGPDRGYVREAGDLPAMEEADLVLGYALALAERLRQRGFLVAMTRQADAAANPSGGDVNGDGMTIEDDPPWPAAKGHWMLDDLQARINACNAAGADLLVSLHVNGHPSPDARGFESWYTWERPFGERNRRFAQLAYAHLKEQFAGIGYVLPPDKERGAYPDSEANVQSEHARFKHFVITGPAVAGAIDPSRMPGAIVETLYLSNDGDAAYLADPGSREAIVTAYERAIVEYFAEDPARIAGSTPAPSPRAATEAGRPAAPGVDPS